MQYVNFGCAGVMVSPIASQRKNTVGRIALHWVLSHPEVSVAISGLDTADELDEPLGALGRQLTDDERQRPGDISQAA